MTMHCVLLVVYPNALQTQDHARALTHTRTLWQKYQHAPQTDSTDCRGTGGVSAALGITPESTAGPAEQRAVWLLSASDSAPRWRRFSSADTSCLFG
jgi:hypothetical protein